MCVKPAQCVCVCVCGVRAQTWKIMIKNAQKYFYNNQDKKVKYSLKTLCFQENRLSFF